MKILKLALVFAAVCVITVVVAYALWKKSCNDFLENTQVSGQYIIEKGSSYPQVYRILFGGHETPKGFNYYLTRILKIDRKLHYGYYAADNISLDHLLGNLLTGKQTLTKVNFPEGYNMYDIAATIAAAGIATKEEMLSVFKDRAFVQELVGTSYESLEGFLAPGTYFFQKQHAPKGMAEKMVSEFYKSLPADFEAKAAKQGLSFYDAVTVASIVQKETYSADEAPLVAAVFINRIKKKMLIQADPTIIYGLYESFDGNIRYKNLRDKTNRYNTYDHKGLTPTPISNPPAIALDAVATPANVDYLYFVATKDGKHVFSKTYEEHQRNVNIHQLGGK